MTKIDEWKARILARKPTIILLTETWLHESVPDSLIAVPGYKVYRKDRSDQKGGGVCVMVQENIHGHRVQSAVSNKYETVDPIDSLWLDLLVEGNRLLVSCVYRPKATTTGEANSHLVRTMAKACSSGAPTFVFGDFNYPEINWETLSVHPNNACSADFLAAYNEMNAFQLVYFPTRFRNGEQSLLDLVLVNDKRLIYDIVGHPPIGKSDHIVVTAKSQLQLSLKPTRKVYKRHFWSADYSAINEHLLKCFSITSTSNSYEHLVRLLSSTIETFIPVRLKIVNPQKPWLTKEIFKSINRKRKLWHAYRTEKTDNSYHAYRTHNNFLKQQIHDARKKFEQDLADSSGKRFYSYISRSLSSRLSGFSLVDETTNLTNSSETEIAERFADQFQSVFTNEDLVNMPLLDPSTFCTKELENISFTPGKVESAIRSLKASSSPGEDEIPGIFLINCAEALSGPLSDVMSEIFRRGQLPQEWKRAIVIPVYKKGDKRQPGNYRPISLTSTLCKCLEKIVVWEMTPFLLDNNIIPTSQHGFVPGRSTFTSLLSRIQDWTLADDRGEPTDVFYLDFEKAFDKVPFSRLLYKLNHYGIRGQLLDFIADFLHRRHFRVKIGSVVSQPREVTSGVPQGSVLGPLLFLAYISDLPVSLLTKTTSFADDTNCHCNPLLQYDDLQQDIMNIKAWTVHWQMPLNDSKCTVLHLGKNNPRLPYKIGLTQVSGVEKQRDLGIVITEDFKWETHINSVIKKANTMIFLITRAFKDPTPEVFLKLYKTFIRPRLEYAQSIWSPYYVGDIEALERVQRRATKVPPELRNLSYETRLLRLGLPTLYQRRLRGDLIETYKVISGHYNCDLDVFNFAEGQQLRGHSLKLSKERCSKLLRRNFFSNRIVYNWNRLSEETVLATSINQFKNRLDRELAVWGNSFVHYPQ